MMNRNQSHEPLWEHSQITNDKRFYKSSWIPIHLGHSNQGQLRSNYQLTSVGKVTSEGFEIIEPFYIPFFPLSDLLEYKSPDLMRLFQMAAAVSGYLKEQARISWIL